jgi:phosphatidylglycerophosphate synthase
LVKATDGPVARYLNRPVSTRISMAIARFRPHPDVLSVLAFLLGLGGAALLWTGTGPAAAVAVQLASILDGVDGEVARLQHRARAQGAVLDGVLDRLADAAIAAGLAVWASSLGHVSVNGAVVLAVAATALSLLSMATKDRIASLGLAAAPERRLNLLLGGRDGRLLLVALSALVGQPLWALAAIVVTCGLSLVLRLLFVMRRS